MNQDDDYVGKEVPAEPHAELRAMYAQQVEEGTLGDYDWQFRGVGRVSWLPIL